MRDRMRAVGKRPRTRMRQHRTVIGMLTSCKSAGHSSPAHPQALLVALELELLSRSRRKRQFVAFGIQRKLPGSQVGCASPCSLVLSRTAGHIVVVCWKADGPAQSRTAVPCLSLGLYRARSSAQREGHLCDATAACRYSVVRTLFYWLCVLLLLVLPLPLQLARRHMLYLPSSAI